MVNLFQKKDIALEHLEKQLWLMQVQYDNMVHTVHSSSSDISSIQLTMEMGPESTIHFLKFLAVTSTDYVPILAATSNLEANHPLYVKKEVSLNLPTPRSSEQLCL
jgi:hypothetical protein